MEQHAIFVKQTLHPISEVTEERKKNSHALGGREFTTFTTFPRKLSFPAFEKLLWEKRVLVGPFGEMNN